MTRTLETAAVVQTFRRLRAVIPSSSPGRTLETLLAERSKLLRLHYGDQISADLFTEEERRLTRLIEAHREEANADPLPTEESQDQLRSEEHTSELQSLMRISYAVFGLNKKKHKKIIKTQPP